MTVIRRKKQRHRSGLAPAPEVRFRATALEVRSAADGSDTIEIVGKPIVYNTPYKVRDMFGEFEETMLPGIVTGILAGVDCRFLINHDGLPLARTLSGTLTLTDGPDDLESVARLDARQQVANDFAIAVERGDVSQMSVGMIVDTDLWTDDFSERTVVTLSDLLDVSGVTYPASPTTSIAVAQRMMFAAPVESRARMRRLYGVTKALRDGRGLTEENAGLLATALETLHEADDADIPGTAASLREIDETLPNGEPKVEADETEGVAIKALSDLISGQITGARREAPTTAGERREASLSFGDQKTLVYEALVDYLKGADCGCDVWILDLGADWVAYESWNDDGYETCRLSYSLDGDTVTFSGDPEEVVPITTYQPVAPPASEDVSSRALELELEVLELRRLRAT